jgi:hypothetical protein
VETQGCNLAEALKFEDFTDDELRSVLKQMVRKAGLMVDPETVIAATKLVAQGRRLDDFGNAGAVETILGRAKLNKSARLAQAIEARQQARARGTIFL